MRTLLVTGWGGREGEDRKEEVEEDVVDRGGIDQGGDQGGEDVVGGRELREGEVRGLSLASKNVPNVLPTLYQKKKGGYPENLRVSCSEFDLWGARSGHEP